MKRLLIVGIAGLCVCAQAANAQQTKLSYEPAWSIAQCRQLTEAEFKRFNPSGAFSKRVERCTQVQGVVFNSQKECSDALSRRGYPNDGCQVTTHESKPYYNIVGNER